MLRLDPQNDGDERHSQPALPRSPTSHSPSSRWDAYATYSPTSRALKFDDEAMLPLSTSMMSSIAGADEDSVYEKSRSRVKLYPRSRCNLSNRGLTNASASNAVSMYSDTERVDMSCNLLKSVKCLAGCRNLTWLSVAHNDITQLAGLWAAPCLRHFDVSHNLLTSTLGAGNCPELISANFAHNRISVVEGMETLRALTHLNLANNRIRSRASLRALSCNCRLQELVLEGNPAASAQKLRHAILDMCPSVLFLDGNKMSPSPRYARNALSYASSSSAAPGPARVQKKRREEEEEKRVATMAASAQVSRLSMMSLRSDDERRDAAHTPSPPPKPTNAQVRERSLKKNMDVEIKQHRSERECVIRKGIYPSGDIASSWAASLRGGQGARPISTPRGLVHLSRSDISKFREARAYDAWRARQRESEEAEKRQKNAEQEAERRAEEESAMDIAARRFGLGNDSRDRQRQLSRLQRKGSVREYDYSTLGGPSGVQADFPEIKEVDTPSPIAGARASAARKEVSATERILVPSKHATMESMRRTNEQQHPQYYGSHHEVSRGTPVAVAQLEALIASKKKTLAKLRRAYLEK